MEIIGNGFVARNFRPLIRAHGHAVLFASGVSGAAAAEHTQFAREAALLRAALSRCAADGRQLVYFSTASGGLYGMPGPVPAHEGGPVRPRSPYGLHKRAMEELIAASAAPHLILRLATPAGPHQRGHQFLPALAAQVRGGLVHVYRGACRDVIDMRHVVAAVDELLAHGVCDETVNVATGFPVPVEEVVAELEARLRAEPAVRRYVDGAAPEPRLAVGKLRRLAPSVDAMGFGPRYIRGVLDRYVGPVLSPAGPYGG